MNNYKYEKEIKNGEEYLKFYYEGCLNKSIDLNYLEDIFRNYFDNLNFHRELDKIIGDIRTIFRDFNEVKLFINLKNGKNDYDVCYINKELLRYSNKSKDVDMTNNFDFNNLSGISFILNKKDIAINSSYNNKYINIYLNRIKELSNLRNISINKISHEILYINELYKLFYGKYPNYNSNNINLEIQNVIYILSEYGIYYLSNYKFTNYNEKRIPISGEINELINSVKPYGYLDSSNIVIDKKQIDIINIIKKSIKNVKSKDVDFKQALTYLSMVLYATKYNLKLGYTLEGITETLNCPISITERGLRLYKNLNKNLYEKN